MLDFILLNSQAFLNGEHIFRAFLIKSDKYMKKEFEHEIDNPFLSDSS